MKLIGGACLCSFERRCTSGRGLGCVGLSGGGCSCDLVVIGGVDLRQKRVLYVVEKGDRGCEFGDVECRVEFVGCCSFADVGSCGLDLLHEADDGCAHGWIVFERNCGDGDSARDVDERPREYFAYFFQVGNNFVGHGVRAPFERG